MVDKTRARLRPRTGRNLDTALDTRAAGITANDIADPNAVVAEPVVAEPVVAEPVVAEPVVAEPVVAEPVVAEDDDWISSLTMVGDVLPGENNQPPTIPQEPVVAPTADAPPAVDLDAAAESRRLERLRGMSTIDEEVAREIYDNVLKPELDELRASYDQQVKDISGTLTAQQQRQEEFDRNKVAQQRAKTNDVILEKHPHAGKILQSTEFMAFLKTKEDPYAQQSKYDILNKAYSAGDAEYVLRELDAFADTRRKPRPQASVDVNSGGSPNTSGSNTKQPMSEQQYLAERRKIMSRRHKPADLTKLYNQYTASQQ